MPSCVCIDCHGEVQRVIRRYAVSFNSNKTFKNRVGSLKRLARDETASVIFLKVLCLANDQVHTFLKNASDYFFFGLEFGLQTFTHVVSASKYRVWNCFVWFFFYVCSAQTAQRYEILNIVRQRMAGKAFFK